MERFLSARRGEGRVTQVSPTSLALPLACLRSIGVAPGEDAAPPQGHLEELLEAYHRYLLEERGLGAGTVATCLRVARSFAHAAPEGSAGLEHLRAADVTGFVVALCGQCSPSSARKTVTALACLLRYLHVSGITATPLASAVPKVAGQRAGPRSRRVEPFEVARLLSNCDRRRSVGRRDYAILPLLSRLGLRAGEVAALRLDDLDWHRGELLIRGKGDRHERLPLPWDAGEAVAAYLRRGRPSATQGCRALFLRTIAPSGAHSARAVQNLVRHAARRAGLPDFGPHRLRHCSATAILRHGAPLPEVAQLLRQRSLAVTAMLCAGRP